MKLGGHFSISDIVLEGDLPREITSNAEKFHFNFPDPAKATGTEEEILNKFREVRNMIKKYSQEFVGQHL